MLCLEKPLKDRRSGLTGYDLFRIDIPANPLEPVQA